MDTPDIKLPGYDILRELGRGAMGVVYAARQVQLGRSVAVKVIDRAAGESSAAQRFLREAQLCMALSHPHVVKVYDAGETTQYLYLAMEVIEGRSLDRVLAANGALPPAQLLALMEQLAEALAYVHSRNIVHRDLKPANVMLSASAAKLMDFGLARGDTSKTLTGANMLVGSPRYLSPEAIVDGTMDAQADLYALGLTFHEMATGTPAYSGLEFKELMRKIVQERVPPPSRVLPGIPASIEQVIMRLLEKDRAVRTPTAQALLDEIRAVRDSAEFLGTSWETSRAQLLNLAAQVPPPSSPPPSRPARATGRLKLSTGTQTAVGSFAPKSSVSDSFVLPQHGAGGMAAKAIAGALVVALIAMAAWATRRGPLPVPAPAAPGVDTRMVAIEDLAAAVQRADLRSLIEGFEREVQRVPRGPATKDPTVRAARALEFRAILRKRLGELAFARAFRALTGHGPFPEKKKIVPLLADASLPLPARRRVYDALLFLSHLDDFFENRCGVGPAFSAQEWLDPWARVLEPPGTRIADLAALCDGGVTIHRNVHEESLYLFAGLTPVTVGEGTMLGSLADGYRKQEDARRPEVDLSKPYEALDLHALTEDVDRLRWVRLDFETLGADEERTTTLVVRPLHAPESVSAPRILGLHVDRALLPPARYKVRIRSFRLLGQEQTGCRVNEVCARMR